MPAKAAGKKYIEVANNPNRRFDAVQVVYADAENDGFAMVGGILEQGIVVVYAGTNCVNGATPTVASVTALLRLPQHVCRQWCLWARWYA